MSSNPDPHVPKISRVFFQGSLRNNFLWVLLPISVFFIMIMGGATYLRARNAIHNQVNAQLNQNLEALTADINQWLNTKRIRLDLAVRQETFQAALRQNILSLDQSSPAYIRSRQIILDDLQQVTLRTGTLLFNHFFITLPDGEIIAASKPDWERQNISETSYFQTLSTQPGSMAIYNPQPLFEDETIVITSTPFYDNDNRHQATIFGVSGSLSILALLDEVSRFNPWAESYILTQSEDFIGVDPYQKTLIREDPSAQQANQLLPLIEAPNQPISQGQNQIAGMTSFDGTPVIANYHWLEGLKAGIVIEVPQEIAFGEINSLGPYILAVTMVLGALLGAGVWITTQRLVSPLRSLTEVTEEFAQGNWDRRAPVDRQDEIGLLAHTFNQMADDLSASYQSLEAQVIERTRSYEKRSQQLEATAQVAREAAAIRNLDELLTNITHLISENFGLYHAGIFLLDEVHKFAVLQAANSEGGQRMLARSHRLEVGRTGVVGYAAETGLPRIALDVGMDAYYFDNPDLPDTRSELALPLVVHDQVIGVLDVQSTEPAAFIGSDVEVLQILADQVALAIENTRLLEQSQVVIRELQHAYGIQIQTAWNRWTRDQTIAYHFDRVRVSPTTADDIKSRTVLDTDQPKIHNTKDGSTLTVPILLRDQKLGSIILQRDVHIQPWTADDLSIVRDSIGQIAVALENARLLDETRRFVEHEQTISDVSTQLSQTSDIDSILRTAIRNLSQLPNVADVSVHIGTQKHD